MSYIPTDLIEVFAWGRFVGAVVLDPQTNVYAFEYDESWIERGEDLSPLHLPRRRGVFEFPELSRETYYGLPALSADALPDRFGNALVTAWMAEQGVDASQISPLDRLAYASDRTMGALSFAPPARPQRATISMVQVADLVAAARAQIEGSLEDDDVHDALTQLITVGSTAGGARAKAVIAYNRATGQIRSGQVSAPAGYEQWLLKLDGVGDPSHGGSVVLRATQPYGRVEYAYYLMARAAGIAMNDSQLLLEGPRAHFLTKRFDRSAAGERIHVQTLCALAHLDYNLARTHSYGSYFLTARRLGLGPDDFQQIFRRAAFNIFGVNRDDHAKNFSFLLPESGTWQLAPAYDVTHSNWVSEWTQAHQMSVNGRFVGITLDDLRAMGDLYEVPAIEGTLRDVAAAIAQWRTFAATAGVDEMTVSKIADDHEQFRPR